MPAVGSISFMNKECAGLAGCWRIAIRAALVVTCFSISSRFTASSTGQEGEPRRVAARARQTCDQSAFQRVGRRSHDDRDALRCALRGADRSAADDYDDIDLRPQQIADQGGYRVDIITIMAKLVGDVAPFDITEIAHPAHEFLAEWIVARGSRPDVPDTRRLARLLRAHRQRPRRRVAEQRDELAPPHHSITSSARVSNVAGTSRPRALAVLRLMSYYYLVGACTGRSAAFSLLRMRST